MVRSLVILLLISSGLSAATPPRTRRPDPFEIGRMGIQFGTEDEMSVGSIEEGLPVAKSGLQIGDVFEKVGPVVARERTDIQRFVFGLRPGTKIKVVVRRNNEKKELVIQLGEANDEIRASARRLANTEEEIKPE